MRVQAPPNLLDLVECRALLDAGVDDFGGISPLTPEHVNPERPCPRLSGLDVLCTASGFSLWERLAVHSGYLRSPWVDPRLSAHVDTLAGADGLAREGVDPRGLPWQELDGGLSMSRGGSASMPISTVGRTEDRRGDFEDVYGDWQALRERAQPATAPGRLTTYADQLRREAVGDEVTYVVNRSINFTNICYTGCRFCAFVQRKTDADAYTLSLDKIATRAPIAVNVGATVG